MSLSSFKVHVHRGHARLRFSDGHGRDLKGSEVMPIVAFTSDLVAKIARRRRGKIHGFSVDLISGVLRATVCPRSGEAEVVRIEGAHMTPRPSPVEAVAYSARSSDVETTIVGGEVLYDRDGTPRG